MAKLLIVLFALCVVPSIAAARYPKPSAAFYQKPFSVHGKAYCDACLAGFETTASHPVAGALVGIQCTARNDASLITYSQEAVTDHNGNYHMLVLGDRLDDVCDVVLKNSPIKSCSQVDPNRDRSRVILTRYNGMASDERFTNALAFLREKPLDNCAEVMKQYQETETDD